MKKILLLVCIFLLMISANSFAAPFDGSSKPFDNKNNGIAIAIGEVHCYGQYDLSKFVEPLYDSMRFSLNHDDKFYVVGCTPNQELMKNVHMNAIIRSHIFNRGVASVELLKYANKILGKNSRPSDDELKLLAKQVGTPYALDADVAMALKEYAAKEGVNYFIFANLNYVEVWLRNSIFNADVSKDRRGKSVSTDLEYYLVNAQTGMVYDGIDHQKTTAQQMDFFIASYGKALDMDSISSGIMDKHVKSISKKILSEGFKRLNN